MVSRMQFLRGDFSGRNLPLRPPWSTPEDVFLQRCVRCGDCLTHCPTSILRAGPGGYPVVDFEHGECRFCGDCVAACRHGALQRADGDRPWTLVAVIDPGSCLATRHVECRRCADPCEPRAIRWQAGVGTAARPMLDGDVCTGCGACVAVCPVQAVSLRAAA